MALLVLLGSLAFPSQVVAQKLVTGAGPGMGPSVRVFDYPGTDRTFLASDPGFLGGVTVALGDVDGDGGLDIITGAGPGNTPFVRVWNGATLAEIGSFFAYDLAFLGGVNVAAGDVNGDGRADIITGAGPGGGPHVRMWDGATFTEIGGFFAYDDAFPGGVNVAAADVDGDGLVDVITGAGPGGRPHVRVWNGATLAEIGGFDAYDPAFPGGVNVAAGDIDGDGLADIVTGAGPGGGPHVRVWSGATLTEIGGSGFFAYDPAFPGGVRVGLSDLERDGRNEIVTGPTDGVAVVRIWTGTTYTLLGEYLAFDPSEGGTGVFIGSVAQNPSMDDAPGAIASTPGNGSTNVAVGADLVVTFSEIVNVASAAFQLTCGSPIPLTITTASPASQFTLHPASPLPLATSCTLRIIGSGVTDDDAIDPPDRMVGDSTVSFTTSACATITVMPTSVPGGNLSVAYAPVTFSQTGGTAPISWSITSGTLPAGMNFSAAGVLSGTPTQSGAFPLTITATATGGCTGSVSLTLNIGSGPNVAPSFVAGPNPSALEDAGAQTVAGWATSISPGPPHESTQTVTFNVTGNTNAALFAVAPAVSPTGTLTYTPAANANGAATITLVLQDNGGTALGGVDTSSPQSFTITVTAVNDAPSFTIGPDQMVPEDAGPQTVVGWATALSPGPPDESGQALTFTITGNTNQPLFSAGPLVSPTGTLTFTPAPGANGTATITLSVSDDGGTANGGVNTSSAIAFMISVAALNSAPSFVAGANQTVLEDAGAQTVTGWATSMSPGPPDEALQTVTFNVTGNTNPTLFSAGPAVALDGTLTYTPAANANGTATITLTLSDDGGTAGGGVDTSAPQTFTITVTPVNDAPGFTVGADQIVNENSGPHTIPGWATAIVTGPPNEAAQTLTFNVTGNTNPMLFSVAPAVSPTGTLTYAVAPGRSGSATITLTLSDDAGTANGGADTSAAQTFTVTVTGINAAPSFTAGAAQTVLEDAGAQSVPAWASNIDPGGPDEAGQALTFNVTGNTNPALFSVAPAVSPAGTLSYTPAPNANGTATITLTLSDDGGTANGGIDTSAPQSFVITVTAVNDAPGFTSGGNRVSVEDAGPQSFVNWATAINPGPPDEAAQSLAFVVTGNTNPALFSIAPAVSSTGTLTYASAPNTFGSATITLVLQDSGGTANGGVNTSAPVTFTITVTAINDAPVLTTATIAYATAGNTHLHVAGATRPGVASIADAGSILTKSVPIDLDGPAPLAVVPFSGATPNGNVNILADGSFSYVPAVGFTGTDTFTFQVTDSVTPVTGTINVTVTQMVWYVNNQTGPNNAVGGDGRSTNAFETLAAASTASGNDSVIFVFNGISATTPLAGGIALKQGQHLHGEGIGLSLTGFGTIVAAGTQPRVESAANTVAVTANTANGNRTGIQIRGLNLRSTGATTNAIDVTSANAANLEVRISENTIAGAGAEGIDINQGSTGTATLAVHDNTVTSTGNAIDIARTGGTVTITAFDDNVVTGATVARGIIVVGTGAPVTFDATPGGALDVVSGGTTRIGQAGDGVGNAGMTLTNVSGNLQFDVLDIFSDSAGALIATGTGAFTGAAGTRIGVTGGGSLNATAGQGLSLTSLTADLSLASLTVTSSTSTGLTLATVSGTIVAAAGSIANTTGISVSVTGGTVGLSYGGNITQTANAAMISVAGGHTTGAVTFGGTLSATNGTGLQFNNADSTAAYSFPGTVTLNGGDAGIDIVGGSDGTFIFGANTTIANPTGTAFNLASSNAGVIFSGSITDATGFAVDINTHISGTVTFQVGSIVSTGTGIRVANNTGGTINFNSPTISLTTGTNIAVTLNTNNAGGVINFNPAGGNGLDISTTTGTGFSALGGGTITVQGAGNTIVSTGGPAINLLNVTVGAGGISFATTTSGGGANGVRLASVTGGAVALGSGSIAGTTASAFLVGDGAGTANTGGTSAITYSGTIASTGTRRAVDVQDRSAGAGNITLSGQITHTTGNINVIFLDGNAAGTITFSGAGSVLNGGTATAVLLTNNTGATIAFTGGGLDIDATSGGGFHATGGGTVSVAGTGNTIATTTGVALNITNTTIGGSGLVFQSIAAAGGANGIVLNNTGVTAGLTVTGNGGVCTSATPTCTGGRIRNTVGADNSTATPIGTGIVLNNTRTVSLSLMQIDAHSNYAIRGTNVQGFTLNSVVINGTNGTTAAAPFNDGSIRFTELTGAATITNSSIAGAAGNNMAVINTAGTLDRLTVTGTTFGTMSGTLGQNALIVESQGTAVINMTVQNSVFGTARGDHIARLVNSTSTSDTVITANTITNSLTPPVGGGVAIRLAGGNNAGINPSATFNISNNTMRGSRGPALTVNRSGGTGTWSGTISTNTVGATGASGSGSLDASGIYMVADGTGTYTAAITGNTVRQYDNHGILAQAGVSGVAGSAAINLTVTGNTVIEPEPVASASATNGFQLDAGTTIGDAYQVCLSLSGNTMVGSGQESTPASGVAQDFRVRQRESTTVRLPGYAGSATNVAAVVAFLQGQNPGGESGLANIAVPPGGGFVNGAACQIP